MTPEEIKALKAQIRVMTPAEESRRLAIAVGRMIDRHAARPEDEEDAERWDGLGRQRHAA